MSILDKPLAVIFPELNSLQINMIRELMKREYERGLNDQPAITVGKPLTYEIKYVSEPTPMNYTPNTEVKE